MLNSKAPQDFLTLLPYRFSLYDKNLQLIYSNNQSDGSFFPDAEKQELPKWIWEALQTAPDKSLHLPVADDAFERILIQTYQALYDNEGVFQGICSYIQDLKPMLNTYLNESGQALVGWSDATSGPSIKPSQTKTE
ncbi:sodium transporter [Streptococcus dentiloxodontae]